jgi:hypothetical protein
MDFSGDTQKSLLTVGSGLLRGQFNHSNTGNAVTLTPGVVFRDKNFGRGLFPGTNQGGAFKLEVE